MDQYTEIHPLALSFTLVAGFLMLLLPRRAALVPLLFAIVFIPLQQRVVVFTLDFYIIRILVLLGWIRVLFRAEHLAIRLNRLDRAMLLFAASSIVVYTLLWKTSGAFVNRLGISFDILGVYFLTRFLVRSLDDMVWVVKTLAVVSIPVAAAMLVERSTGRNIFSIFGGVPEYTVMRDGKLRSQGAFAHSITAGTFSASLLPLFFAARRLKGRRSLLMYAGLAAASVITVCTSSSGPALAYLAGIIGIVLWPYRRHMRQIRWAVALTLIALHIVMKAPVWALILRVKIFGASTAYHRYRLFDQFVNRVGEWWLTGVQSTASWGYYLFDVTNYFIRIAVDGGLATLAVFITVLVMAFGAMGRAASSKALSTDHQRMAWALGAALFVHVVSFFGVSYFDQIRAVLYMLVAMIGAMKSISEKEASAERVRAKAALKGVTATA